MNKLKRLPKPPKQPKKAKRVQTNKRVMFDLTPEWISLYMAEDNRPDLQEAHDILKFNLLLIHKVTGVSLTMILQQILKDINDNLKARQKFVLDDWSDAGIKDYFQIKVEHFKRYK
jgi:hypothetical protein